MNRTIAVRLLVSLCLGAAAILWIQLHSEEELATVVVAKHPVRAGTWIENATEYFEERPVPVRRLPAAAIRTLSELDHRFTRRSVEEGNAVQPDDLFAATFDPFSVSLPTGFCDRCIAAPIDSLPMLMVAMAGSRRVDIDFIRSGTGDRRVLLENVLLRTITPALTNQEGDFQPHVSVVVAVTPEGVMKLNLAQEIGTIQIRRVADRPQEDAP